MLGFFLEVIKKRFCVLSIREFLSLLIKLFGIKLKLNEGKELIQEK